MPSALADPAAPRRSDANAPPGVRLRLLDRISDFRNCVALQEATWGRDGETVHVSMLAAATKVGGLILGAVDADDGLLGFVFGLAGVDAAGPLHWSHMLAVRQDARGAGIGRALKEHQRRVLVARGVRRIAWTFDPLQARNAHLNINRLGARIREYIDDMYGVTGSPLHLGLATDRLVAMTAALGAEPPTPSATDWALGGLILSLPGAGEAEPPAGGLPDQVLVEIPWDIEATIATDHRRAAAWREATRAHFHMLLSRGFAVGGFVRDRSASRAFYGFNRAPEVP